LLQRLSAETQKGHSTFQVAVACVGSEGKLNRERFEAVQPDMALIQDRVNKTLAIVHVIPSAC
jgi:hypothetical protein